MAGISKKSFESPDETRTPDKTRLDVVDLGSGDVYVIEPGHDAWVIGNEPFVAYEFESKTAETFAKS